MKRIIKLFGVFVSLCISQDIQSQDFNLHTGDNLPDIGRGASVWADFNNDMLIDVAVTGMNNAGTKVSGIYFNNGDGTFTISSAAIAEVSDASIAVGDINNDGLIDILISGADNTSARVTRLYKNLGSGVFTLISNTFSGVAFGGSAITDINNDGKSDIVINGVNGANERITKIYLNNGDESFSLSEDLEGLSNGGLLIVDLDNDGYVDLVQNGIDNNNQIQTQVYYNDKGQFILSDISLPDLRGGKYAAADVNNDGYIDLFINGLNNSGSARSDIYVSNTGLGFTLMANLPAYADGAGAFADYNNDGFTDLVYFGFNNPNLDTYVYLNNAGAGFIDSGEILPGNSSGSVSWIDFDNDLKIDFMINGYASSGPFNNIYENIQPNANTAPSPPSNLTSVVTDDEVTLLWDDGIDSETPGDALTYEIYVGTSSGLMDVVRPASHAAGIRKTVQAGGLQNSVDIIDLGEGQYFWSVQSIDGGYIGSSFASEQQFVICAPVVINASSDAVCPGATILLNAGTGVDTIEWFSLKNPSTPIGSGTDLDIIVNDKDTIIVEVTKPLGCLKRDTIVVDVLPIPAVDLGSDQLVCMDEDITLSIGAFNGNVSWYSVTDPGTSLGTENELTISSITTDDTIVVQIENLNGCTNSDTVNIGPISRPQIDLGDDVSGCPESIIEFSISSSDSINWYSQNLGSVVTNDNQYDHLVTQDDVVWAEIFNNSGCVNYDTVQVRLNELPIAAAGEDQFLCAPGQEVTIGGSYTDTSGLLFSWSSTLGLDNAGVLNPVASPVVATTYVLTVTDQNGCQAMDSMVVAINPPTDVNPGVDMSICIGESVQLGGNPTAIGSELPYTYSWTPVGLLNDHTGSNPVTTPTETTTFQLITATGSCIIDTSSVTITVNPLPEISAGENVTAGYNEEVQLSATGGISYTWTPSVGLDNDEIANPIAIPVKTTTYTVIGRDANGCENSDEVILTLKAEIFIPSLFTPNGDGSNDVFKVFGFGMASIKLKVYDKNGRLIFETDQIDSGWDGTIDGNDAASGDYLWAVEGEYFDGTRIDFQGKNNGIIRLLR